MEPGLQQQLTEIFRSLQQTVVTAVPRILTGIVILIVLVLVAKVVEWLLRASLVRLRFDSLLKQAGIDRMLQRLGIRQSLNLLLPGLTYLPAAAPLARTAADVLGVLSPCLT